MKTLRACVIVAALTMTVSGLARAENHVRIEDRTVLVGDTAAIGVFLTNDVTLLGFSLPLAVRSVDGGAFWSDFDSVIWLLRDPFPVHAVYSVNQDLTDYISPDQFQLTALDGFTFRIMDPGLDPPGSPGIKLVMTVNSSPGSFEIDTLTYPPSVRLEFLGTGNQPVSPPPTFEKSTIRVVDNHVRIQGDTVFASQQATIGVFVTNDVSLEGIDLPLVVRNHSGSAFWTDIKQTNWNLRPTAEPFDIYVEYVDLVDFNSPDQLLLSWIPAFLEGSLQPGTDETLGPGITLLITVGTGDGSFEIDTLTYPPNGSLLFVDWVDGTAIYPTFEKGTVVVLPCETCTHQGDVAPVVSGGDGVVSILDVIALIDYLFRTGPELPSDATCPRSRGDINGGVGDDRVDMLDVVYAIDHVFRSGPPPGDPCNP